MRFATIIFFFLSLIYSGICFSGLGEIQTEINRYVSTGKYDSAEVFIQSELEKPQSSETIIELNYQLVSVLIYNSKYKEALEVAFNAIDTIEEDKEKDRFHFLIACVFYSVQDYKKAIEYFDLLQVENDPSLNAKALLILSDIYSNKNDSIKSLNSLKQANQIGEEYIVDPKLREQIALQYNFRIENFEACKYIYESMIRDSSNFLITKCNALSTIGECLTKQDSLVKATKYYERALKLTLETNDPDLIKTTSRLLIDTYEKIGDQEKANAYHKIYNDAINDSSYFSIDKYRGLYALENQRMLAKQNESNTSNTSLIICTLIALSAICLLIYFRFKKNKNVNLEEHSPKNPPKKIQINQEELMKIERSINVFISSQLYLESNITRKSFCEKNKLKSERYLSQFINDKYEKSFSLFLNDLRVEYAYERLKNDTLFRQYKTSEIAKECGFGSIKTFERVFSSKYKQTPFDFIESVSD